MGSPERDCRGGGIGGGEGDKETFSSGQFLLDFDLSAKHILVVLCCEHDAPFYHFFKILLKCKTAISRRGAAHSVECVARVIRYMGVGRVLAMRWIMG